MKNRSVDVQILGQKIAFKAPEGDPELVEEVVELVSSKLKASEKRLKHPAPHHLALLALLDLAEEYVQARRRVSEHQRTIEEKSQELFQLIEAELK